MYIFREEISAEGNQTSNHVRYADDESTLVCAVFIRPLQSEFEAHHKIDPFLFILRDGMCYFVLQADIVAKISEKLGLEKGDVQSTVEALMEEVKTSLENGDNVYLRGFGSFIIKTRAEKTGRNISKNTTIKIPAHNIPAFKPAKVFVEGVKAKTEVTV